MSLSGHDLETDMHYSTTLIPTLIPALNRKFNILGGSGKIEWTSNSSTIAQLILDTARLTQVCLPVSVRYPELLL